MQTERCQQVSGAEYNVIIFTQAASAWGRIQPPADCVHSPISVITASLTAFIGCVKDFPFRKLLLQPLYQVWLLKRQTFNYIIEFELLKGDKLFFFFAISKINKPDCPTWWLRSPGNTVKEKKCLQIEQKQASWFNKKKKKHCHKHNTSKYKNKLQAAQLKISVDVSRGHKKWRTRNIFFPLYFNIMIAQCVICGIADIGRSANKMPYSLSQKKTCFD